MSGVSEDSVAVVLSEVNLNAEKNITVAGDACAYCSKSGARKRCAKRHAKCLTKLFCDKVCESAGHKKVAEGGETKNENVEGKEGITEEEEDSGTKAVEAEKALKSKKKKAKKLANAAKKKGDGELWWNNSVYASW